MQEVLYRSLTSMFLIALMHCGPVTHCMQMVPIPQQDVSVLYDFDALAHRNPYATTALCTAGACGIGYYWWKGKTPSQYKPSQASTPLSMTLQFQYMANAAATWLNPIQWYQYYFKKKPTIDKQLDGKPIVKDTIQSMISDATPLTHIELETLRATQIGYLTHALSQVSSDSLHRLYRNIDRTPLLLFLSQEKLNMVDNEWGKLQQLFENNEIVTDASMDSRKPNQPWREKEWKKSLTLLAKRVNYGDKATGEENENTIKTASMNDDYDTFIQYCKKIDLNKTSILLKDAQVIIGALVPDHKHVAIEKNLMEKGKFLNGKIQLNRLFTYVRLFQVIKEKQFTHIRLPLKVLIVKDKDTSLYLNHQEALLTLNTVMKVYINSSEILDVAVDYYSNMYELFIYAEKISNRMGERKSKNLPLFNTEASGELKQLITEVPIDMGYNNIFADENGDAIIIDTEFKGDSAEESLGKLMRYGVT